MDRGFHISHCPVPEQLRLAEIRIPAGMFDPPSHEVISPWHKIGVVCGSSGKDHQNLISNLRRALFIRVEAENPLMRTGLDGLITQMAESLERNLNDAGSQVLGDPSGVIRTGRIGDKNLVRPE